jgi:hypothetical protein
MVNLSVTGDTQIVSQGRSLTAGDLVVGQRVPSGAYDPISTEAVRLVLGPPKSLRVSGEITEVDEDQFAITIAPRRGDPVRLSALESTPVWITIRGNPEPRFSDLRVGQRVLAGFYDAGSLEALRLVLD